MSALRSWSVPFAALVVLCAAPGCSRGVDETHLQQDLQDKLNRDVKPGLFEVVALRREGSAPLPPAASGAERVVVYYTVTLRMGENYAFGGWDQLGPASIAYALGATEKGVYGLKPENQAGDVVRAYGSAIYERVKDDEWTPGVLEPSRAAAAPDIEGSAPPSRSKQLIDQLAAMVELPPPGVPPPDDAIIADELARASENIERRVKRRDHTFTIATGPAIGEYARFGSAMIAAINNAAPHVQLRQRFSEGSIENAWLLARGEADYAIVQSDVVAAAFAGEDVFARGGPVQGLRAVGGLFPEAIHVIVLPDSPIRTIDQLRGQRVAVGPASSGTRFDANAVLAASELELEDLAEVSEEPLAEALSRLAQRQVDAVFATGAAPTRALQEFAVKSGLRLIPLSNAAVERVLASRSGLSRIMLPANTYPRQPEPVLTVAATALLVTMLDAPQVEVERVVDLVFTRMAKEPTGGAELARLSSSNQLRGVTIPVHPGAARPQ